MFPEYAGVNVAKDRATAEQALRRILGCALNGNLDACRAVVEIAAFANGAVSTIGLSQRWHADEIARGIHYWPLNVSVHPDHQKIDLRWLTVLPLGEASDWRKVTKGKKPFSLTTIAASTFYSTAAKMECSKNNGRRDGTKEWDSKFFAKVWMRIKEKHAGEPERDPRLRSIGIYNVLAGTLRGSNDEKHMIRDGIRKRLRQAMRAMLTPIR
jgi:hypothetical protein